MKLLARVEAACPAEDGFPATRASVTALLPVRNDTHTGFLQRRCAERPDATIPAVRDAAWDAVDDAHVVRSAPTYGEAFVRLALRVLQLPLAALPLARDDLPELLRCALEAARVDVRRVALFAAADRSSPFLADFLFSFQVETAAASGERVVAALRAQEEALRAQLLALRTVYHTVTLCAIEGTPVILVAPLPLWQRVLRAVGWAALLLALAAVLWKFRKNIAGVYRKSTRWYRQRRRAEVMEEMGYPLDLYFIPKPSPANPKGISFETPYGDIHLVEAIAPKIEPMDQVYIEAESCVCSKQEKRVQVS